MNKEPMDVVREYINAFNAADTEGMAAMFAASGSILDGTAPHIWQGPNVARDWYRDVLVKGEQIGAGNYLVELDEPLRNHITGDSAYVVLPASIKFTVKGEQIVQPGAMFVVALRRLAEGWRIVSWAWAKGKQ